MTTIDARAKRSQNALLRAGMELLNDNHEANLSDIALHAGVGRTTLYRQFENRETLIKAIAHYCLESLEAATAPIEWQARSSIDAIRLMFKLVMPFREEFQFLINMEKWDAYDSYTLEINQQQKVELIAVIDAAKDEGDITKKLPSSWIYHTIEGLFMAGWLHQQHDGCDSDQAAAFAFQSFRSGVAAT